MTEPDALTPLEALLGYQFQDRSLLVHALTHSSRKPELDYCNERLEFLGDAVLGAAISEFLYRRFPGYAEGALTRIKSVVVSRASLARAAKEMRLGDYLSVAKGVAGPGSEGEEQENGAHGRLPVSLVANAFEAVIGAVYLDGGWQAGHDLVIRHMSGQIERACEAETTHNFKSALQEIAQREYGAAPVYRVLSEHGPDHDKQFEVEAVIKGEAYGAGRGSTKKAAEQEAARATLEAMEARESKQIRTEN